MWGGVWALRMELFTEMNFHDLNFLTLRILLWSFYFLLRRECGKSSDSSINPFRSYVSICFNFFHFFSIFFHLVPFVSICFNFFPFGSICFNLFQFFSICFHLFQFFSEKECSKLLWNSEIRNMGVRWINVIVPSLKQRESFVSIFFRKKFLWISLGFNHHNFWNIVEVGWTKIGLRFTCSKNILQENRDEWKKSDYKHP